MFELPLEQQKPIRSEARDKTPKSIAQVCAEIAQRTKTSIDASTSGKSRAITFIVRGRPSDVSEAKRQLWSEAAQSMTSPVEVPEELLGSVIGASGKVLQSIMAETGTKISVPRKSEPYPGCIFVTGDLEGVNEAKSRIRGIVEEKLKKTSERVELPAHLLPFVYGVHGAKVGEQAQVWSERYAVRVSQDVCHAKDEAVVTFSGDREEVAHAVAEFKRLLEEKKHTVRQVSTAVPKGLHRFLVGPKETIMHGLEAETGCVISVPGPGSDSEQVTIYGPQDKLFKGISAVMEKTASVASETVALPKAVCALLFERFRVKISELEAKRDIAIAWAEGGIQVNGYKADVPQVVQEIQALSKPLVRQSIPQLPANVRLAGLEV